MDDYSDDVGYSDYLEIRASVHPIDDLLKKSKHSDDSDYSNYSYYSDYGDDSNDSKRSNRITYGDYSEIRADVEGHERLQPITPPTNDNAIKEDEDNKENLTEQEKEDTQQEIQSAEEQHKDTTINLNNDQYKKNKDISIRLKIQFAIIIIAIMTSVAMCVCASLNIGTDFMLSSGFISFFRFICGYQIALLLGLASVILIIEAVVEIKCQCCNTTNEDLHKLKPSLQKIPSQQSLQRTLQQPNDKELS
jgi:hypothetical protein